VLVQNVVDHVSVQLAGLEGIDLLWGKDRYAVINRQWPKGVSDDGIVDTKAARDLQQCWIEVVFDPGGYHLMHGEVRIRDQEPVVIEVSKVIVLPTFSRISSIE
jgi:hypothetical protein